MSLPWYAWYPSDFRGDPLVATMTLEARGAYRELLDISWGIGPLKDPESTLKLLGGDPALWAQISPCWLQTDEGWVQKRLEAEREVAEKRVDRASKAGKASAKAKAKLKFNSSSTQVPLKNNSSSTQEQLENTPSDTCGQLPTPTTTPTPITTSPYQYTTPVGDGVRAPKKRSRKPSVSDVRTLVKQHIGLQTLPGFEEAAVAWREALTAKRVWASVASLATIFRWLEKDLPNALDYVRICTERDWTSPIQGAARELAAERATPGEDPRFQKPKPSYLK